VTRDKANERAGHDGLMELELVQNAFHAREEARR
jgi:hypothetical protein